jgi:hypothetical protein
MPPPTTTTSTVRSRSSFGDVGSEAESAQYGKVPACEVERCAMTEVLKSKRPATTSHTVPALLNTRQVSQQSDGDELGERSG